MRFSLILTTRGRRDEIGHFFDSLLQQRPSAVAGPCEVLLVDQNDDDRLADLVAAYAGRLTIRHLHGGVRGAAAGRNVGLDHASGELLGFPDDDCEFPAELLGQVSRWFDAHPDIDGITGQPTADPAPPPAGDGWAADAMPLDRVSLFNRCQEFTIFLRRSTVGGTRFNPRLGVGAGTPWGAEEGPDFLVRLVDRGAKLVHLPHAVVYHPNKLARVTRATIARAASYSRGRGAYYRLHRYPARFVARSLVRPAIGCGLYLALLQPRRSAYYAAVATNMARGLCLTRGELADLRAAAAPPPPPSIEPVPLPPLSPRPLVSVLIANYNYARFLPAALDGLLAQTYDRWEAVVVDDGSTDDSAAVAQRYADRDARFRVVRQANGGQASAMGAGMAHVTGEVVCLLDADDVFVPDKIERVVAAFAADPSVGMVNHAGRVIDLAGRTIMDRLTPRLDGGWLAPTAATRGACVAVPTTSCMSYRRPVLAELLPMPAAQRNDADGFLGMAAQYLAKFAVIDAALTDYRIHGANIGGITTPTPERLAKELSLIDARTAVLRTFLRDRFGPAAADAVHAADNPQFAQAALKLHAVAPGHPALADHRPAAMVAVLPSGKWRLLWRAILAAPAPVRRRLIPALHRSHKLRATVRRLLARRPAGRPLAVQPRLGLSS